ncbi:hypothetical protein EZ313_20290 [Ramlibacter henchirensis]|jgi:hypothetical protein|uniref:Uncharacterized protein n=1 Tax=Ramlibacter henchirensis TaxID=204072 RepID=A0A4Z0BNA2_9BURK|nr:hypothetical protein [Ramlibacter henchirensis]TFZ00786.1 hypothetical protein EZ313_20290 [Ramlibacter henchirensis]
MEVADTYLMIKDELESARAEEAEALRRANRLRTTGASPEALRDALREVDLQHSRVIHLQMELRRQLH